MQVLITIKSIVLSIVQIDNKDKILNYYTRVNISMKTDKITQYYKDFLATLKEAGFEGDIRSDIASRIVMSTDNSIYQCAPQAVLHPKHTQDIQCITRLLAKPAFRQVVITPRGGGTGTNGQSLTHGILVDVSTYMNQILEINAEERWVRVQTGVVKDQLNAALKPYGLFFAPELSTSNRATIGGMINTDASGQGSCVYGKTRNHVLELEIVTLGGYCFKSGAIAETQLQQIKNRKNSIGKYYQVAYDISIKFAQLIEESFPKLNRCLTGYDLAHLWEDAANTDTNTKLFNLNSVLCGSEGSLGFMTEAKLNVLPLPKYTALVNVQYPDFMGALRDARTLIKHQPLSIETIDSTVLKLAQEDIIWSKVKEFFPQKSIKPALGINLIEFSGDNQTDVNNQVQQFSQFLEHDNSLPRYGYTIAYGRQAIQRVYAMRKRAVGLLGNLQGEARPQPFVEDTVVPPENLADFIEEFRQLLDKCNLKYGMFGHVDAGVLHVRPALDMKNTVDSQLIKTITDQVVDLTYKYGGLLWGEHGKGLRSEYAPTFFGKLYPALQKIKEAFDPYNQLNPGKIATPPAPEYKLLKVDEITFRGNYDKLIPKSEWLNYGSTMYCNGNGACFNYDLDDEMCPSWKATRNRIHSPKGRASLMKAWLYQKSIAKTQTNKQQLKEFSHEVYEAMSGCLSCKSCVGQCPIRVDIPDSRSRFLEAYHKEQRRPLRDHVIANLELFTPILATFKIPYNTLIQYKWVAHFIKRYLNLVYLPKVANSHVQHITNTPVVHLEEVLDWDTKKQTRAVLIVQDAFTRYFDSSVLNDFIQLIKLLGYEPHLLPYFANGKALQVLGFRERFKKQAIKNATKLSALSNIEHINIIGIDPALTLTYRQEYQKVPGIKPMPKVLLPQEWLEPILKSHVKPTIQINSENYNLHFFGHCTEKTNAPESHALWGSIFETVGLNVEAPDMGCCGMSGLYGHEAANSKISSKIFDLSWRTKIESTQNTTKPIEIMAPGYSCRSQCLIQSKVNAKHPVQILLRYLKQNKWFSDARDFENIQG